MALKEDHTVTATRDGVLHVPPDELRRTQAQPPHEINAPLECILNNLHALRADDNTLMTAAHAATKEVDRGAGREGGIA